MADPKHDDKQSDKLHESALQSTVAYIQKNFGKHAITKMDEVPILQEIEVISTGSLGLNSALGIGGLPKGRITEIYGPESSCKTTLALHVIAEAQKLGGSCAFVDTEHALSMTYAQQLGVKTSQFFLAQPDTGEQALEIANMCAAKGGMNVVVVDSVAALIPKAELEGDIGDSHIGLQARLMSQALKKIASTVAGSNCVFVFINQTRMKVGVGYGSSETTTGGNALKFYSSIRIETRRIGGVKNSQGIEYGLHVRARVLKNKLSIPFRTAEFMVIYGQGISRIDEIIDLGIWNNIIRKSGAWYYFGGQSQSLGQGKEAVKSSLLQNTELANQILQEIMTISKQTTIITGSSSM